MAGNRIRTAMRSVLAVVLVVAAGCASREAEVATNLTPEAAAEIVDLLRDSDGDCVPDIRARQQENPGSKPKDPRYDVLVPRNHLRDAESLLSLNKLPRTVQGESGINSNDATDFSAKSEVTNALLLLLKQEQIEQQLLEFEGVVWAKVMISTSEAPAPYQLPGDCPQALPSASVTMTIRQRECDGVDEGGLESKAKRHVASAFEGLEPSRVTVSLVKQRLLGASSEVSAPSADRLPATNSPRSKWSGKAPLLAAAAGLLLIVVGLLTVVNIKLRQDLKRSLARRPLPGLRRDDDDEER
jgi:type III secretory pathway lipoprotein EscJ